MDTDLHQIIRSPQPLSPEHIGYFVYQVGTTSKGRVASRGCVGCQVGGRGTQQRPGDASWSSTDSAAAVSATLLHQARSRPQHLYVALRCAVLCAPCFPSCSTHTRRCCVGSSTFTVRMCCTVTSSPATCWSMPTATSRSVTLGWHAQGEGEGEGTGCTHVCVCVCVHHRLGWG